MCNSLRTIAIGFNHVSELTARCPFVASGQARPVFHAVWQGPNMLQQTSPDGRQQPSSAADLIVLKISVFESGVYFDFFKYVSYDWNSFIIMSNSRNLQQHGHRSLASNMLSKCFRRFLNVVGPVKIIQYSIYYGDHVAVPAKNIVLDSVFIHLIS